MTDDFFDETTRLNPSGFYWGVGRSLEALRCAYILLWGFAKRVSEGNPVKLDQEHYGALMVFSRMSTSSGGQNVSNYQALMNDVSDELEFFINGSFPGYGPIGGSLEIRDTAYLEAIAEALGDLDGIVGFILAGNPHVSEELLLELSTSEYRLISRGSSTKERALATLELKKSIEN